ARRRRRERSADGGQGAGAGAAGQGGAEDVGLLAGADAGDAGQAAAPPRQALTGGRNHRWAIPWRRSSPSRRPVSISVHIFQSAAKDHSGYWNVAGRLRSTKK